METKYYLYSDDQLDGPYVIDELKHKQITSDSEVWHGELPDWISADQIPELRDLLQDLDQPEVNPYAPQPAKRVRRISKPGRNSYFIFAGSIAAIALLVIFISLLNNATQNGSRMDSQSSLETPER